MIEKPGPAPPHDLWVLDRDVTNLESRDASGASTIDVLARLAAELERSQSAGQRYLLGSALTALDIYLAAFLTAIVGVSEADCPAMPAALRPAFSYLKEDLGLEAPRSLVEHRAFMYSQYLRWPLSL